MVSLICGYRAGSHAQADGQAALANHYMRLSPVGVQPHNRMFVFADRYLQAEEIKTWGEPSELPRYLKKTQSLDNKLQTAADKIDAFNVEETSFGWELTSYPQRMEILGVVKPFLALYEAANEFETKRHEWLFGPRSNLNPDDIEQEIGTFNRTMFKLEKSFSDCPPAYSIASKTRARVENMKERLPLIHALCNPGMRQRHWDAVSVLIGRPIQVTEQSTLQDIINMRLDEFIEKFEPIAEAASKEYSLEKALIKMQTEWAAIVFVVLPYRESGTFIFSAVDEIQLLLDDHIVRTQTMKGSSFIKPFEEQTRVWEASLLLLQDVLDQCLKMQSTWLYLEPIFSSPDIVAQMPEEGRRFALVDKTWREIMRQIQGDPKVLSVLKIDKIREKLVKGNELLELIQKGLNDYLEKKRLYFARFFFLSNDELLEILSETKDPTRVQPHLKKCFEGIAKLEFTPEVMDITHMKSSEDEIVELKDVISTSKAKGQVEKWLLELEANMIESVHKVIRESLEVYPNTTRIDWVRQWPGQAVLCVTQTFWTSFVHEAIRLGPSAMDAFLQENNSQIEEVVRVVRGKLSKQNRTTLQALIVLDVHARDVLTALIQQQVTEIIRLL